MDSKVTEYFEKYSSNTYAGSGNQLYFTMNDGEIRTGRVLYKISSSGEYNYSMLFSNIIDSTYGDGSISHKNLLCDNWQIHSAKVGKCKKIESCKEVPEMSVADGGEDADIVVSDMKTVTFDGRVSKEVIGGEFFSSDPIKMSFKKGEYLCLELTFTGKMIPYHEESLLPVFVKENDAWKYSRQMPLPSMIGCDRDVREKVAFLGDSITQGVGTRLNSYLHWNAVLSRKIGEEYAFWNLGIGYGRANDAASDGVWLYKAKQNHTVFVCYGVNDILQGRSCDEIKSDLTRIVDILKNAGKRVVLQTVPPFNYTNDDIKKWKDINSYIKTVLKDKVDFVFDNVPVLEGAVSGAAKFGGHPNEEGCAIWAEALYSKIKNMF